MRKLILFAASLALATTAFAATQDAAGKADVVSPITMAQARAIALKTMPGRIAKEELEQEKGGSGVRYSFDIVANGVTHEIGVDAKDGKILENSIDNGDD
jgi:uncharacterized membrane protein YkoI